MIPESLNASSESAIGLARRIADQSHCESAGPEITIICWTYNHEKFIRQTIENILAQMVSVAVEIIVHDDASSDGTLEVLREYADRYHAVFKLITPGKNQLQQGINFVPALFKMARGRYIAICDGDDFWTCPDKLMKQWAQLESRPDASGCFHRADDLVEQTGQVVNGYWGAKPGMEKFTLDDLFQYGNLAPTASLMLRRECVLNVPGTGKETPHGDFTFLMAALRFGPLLILNESMSVYRRHSGGQHSAIWGSLATFKALKSLVFASHLLGLEQHPAYLSSFRWRESELENCIHSDRARIAALEQELETVRNNFQRFRQSRTLRFAMHIDKLFKSIQLRKS